MFSQGHYSYRIFYCQPLIQQVIESRNKIKEVLATKNELTVDEKKLLLRRLFSNSWKIVSGRF